MSTPSSRTKNANHARQRAIKTMLEQLEATLRQMQRERALITIAAAARRARVSRSFIYQNPQARQLVAQAAKATAETRADDVAHKAEQVEAAWKDRALNSEDGIKAAHAEIVAQRGQIGQLLARLRDTKPTSPMTPTAGSSRRTPLSSRRSATSPTKPGP